MTDLTKLNDAQKSVILARLCLWQVVNAKTKSGTWDSIIPDLYNPANMALAWRVLNWAMTEATGAVTHGMAQMAHPVSWPGLMMAPPDIAQRAWLDKVLELAIEAGMVTP
jgi:hypothetical protein